MSNHFLLVNSPPYLLLDAVRLQTGNVLVGRSSAAGICLPDRTVSREHAEIRVSDHEISICDLNSANGTFVDNVQITQPMTVRKGQRLRFGRVSFEVTDMESYSKHANVFEVETDPIRPDAVDRFAAAVRKLTAAQKAVFDLAITGTTPLEIARLRHLSHHTVHNHLRRIYEVFNVHSQSELLILRIHKIRLQGNESARSGIEHTSPQQRNHNPASSLEQQFGV